MRRGEPAGDEVPVATGGAPTLLERLLPPVELAGEDGNLKPSRMTPREQLVAAGLGLANVAITAGTAGVVHRQQALVLLAGLAASVITVVGARVGNRILTMVGLFASTLVRPSSALIFLAIVLPYYGGALWIFLKYNRLVKEQGVLRRQQRAEGRGAASGSRPGRTTATRAGSSAAKAGPPRSKRYTPPKPQKKRPAPPTKPPRDRSIVD
ncbi:MAG: hypothetical protein ABIS47_10815 [Acidimicrobiales bacterium]